MVDYLRHYHTICCMDLDMLLVVKI